MNSILPRGRYVEMDVAAYLREAQLTEPEVMVEPDVESPDDESEDDMEDMD